MQVNININRDKGGTAYITEAKGQRVRRCRYGSGREKTEVLKL